MNVNELISNEQEEMKNLKIENNLISSVESIINDIVLECKNVYQEDFYSNKKENDETNDITFESMMGEIFTKKELKNNKKETNSSVTVESMMNEILSYKENDISNEVYFGIDNPFSKEMINLIKLLQDDISNIYGDENDIDKLTNNISADIQKSTSIILKRLEEIDECISRHCNIEKCYIGLVKELNAYTLPMVWDSNFIINDLKNSVYKNYIDQKYIRKDKDIDNLLLKLEDITIQKNGYKFKDKQGKIFIINLGIPLLIKNDFTPEEVCSTIFHELGHNFQQILRGANQVIIDTAMKKWIFLTISDRMTGLCSILFDLFFNNRFLKFMIFKNKTSSEWRYAVIKLMLFNNIFLKDNGEIVSRDDIGKTEKEHAEKLIKELIRDKSDKEKEKIIKRLSITSRILNVIGNGIVKIFSLIQAPFQRLTLNIIKNDLDKNYKETITKNKAYEQFADTFAVAYGFGSYASLVSIKFLKDLDKRVVKTHKFLNKIPILAKMEALNNYMTYKTKLNLSGYDEDYVRLAQSYKVLEYELANNKDLSDKDRKRIIEDMKLIKENFEKIKDLEEQIYTKNLNKSIAAYILKSIRSKSIDQSAVESGIVENVIEAIDEYEKTGNIKRDRIDDFDDKDERKNNKFFDKIGSKLKDSLNNLSNFFKTKF
jgi:hypothetical protein